MCRIFGFRSVLDSGVHQSLIAADNALAVQSREHPHGWGVAYYASGAPHLIRGAGTAFDDALFRRVGAVVSSQTVLAHVRNATQGAIGVLNCHPFQHGRWVFAHNGDVPAFGQVKDKLLALVHPRLRPYQLGTTDSELLFLLFLSYLSKHTPLDRRGVDVQAVVDSIKRVVADVQQAVDAQGLGESLLTFVVTDGEIMVAHKWGRPLWWSTHKNRCPDRTACPYFSAECEAPSQSGFVNHLLVASEPLQGENIWTPMHDGQFIAVDGFMRLAHAPL